MRPRFEAARFLIAGAALVAVGAVDTSAALPPGKPYVLTLKGDSTVTFVPETGMAPLPIDYKASIEYLVNTRDFKDEAAPKNKARRRPTRTAAEKGPPKAAGAVEFALHSAEIALRHREQMVIQTRIRRSRFQGRLLPDAPVLTVSHNESPALLRDLLDRFDTAAAVLAIDDNGRVIDRRTRFEGPLHAIVETLMSIHTPIPGDASSWDVPAQLAMGHGQTARGTLRFEKANSPPGEGPIQVKVSGVLRAEGTIVGNLIKDGTYKVTGEQTYDPKAKGWRSARWSVEIETELAAQGATVAHARGKMIVESRALAPPPARDQEPKSDPATTGTKAARRP
jgi:hypothetical protein